MKPIYLKPKQSVLFVAMKDEPTIFPFGPIAELIAVGKRPFIVGEICYVREAWGVGTRPHPCLGWVDGIEYKADEQYLDEHDDLPLYQVETPDDVFLCDYESGWKSPVTMPEWASRRHVRIVSCEPIRVEYVTEEDIIKAGLADGSCVWANGAARCNAKGDLVVNQFMDNWHKKHPGKQWAWRVITEEAPLS
jgi:hypothetical protein